MSQEARIVTADRAHGLLAGAGLFAKKAFSNTVETPYPPTWFLPSVAS